MKSNFQTILVIIFVVVFGAAVLVFSGLISFGSKSSTTATPQGNVVMWGIVSRELVQPYLDTFNIGNAGYTISYVEHDPQTFKQDIITALADGVQPDLVLISSELFSGIKDKLYVTPYTTFPERTYRDTNVDGAQVFLTKDGVIAQPIVVDPLVVYYNKDILAQASFVIPPITWSNLQQSVGVLTKKDKRNTITQSTIALGTAGNIAHVRDIISALFLQTGSTIVAYNPTIDSSTVTLNTTTPDGAVSPLAQALTFYTSFSDPTNTNYSWNNALPNSLDMFIAGRSAFYIGRASELFTIQSQNPNLNFDVKELFQTSANPRPVTFGSFFGIGILKASTNLITAYAASGVLSSKDAVDAFSKRLSLPPVRRDLLLVQQTNPYVAVFFRAAVASFAWQDPNPVATEQIFRDMITNVTSGRANATTAISDAARDIQSLVK